MEAEYALMVYQEIDRWTGCGNKSIKLSQVASHSIRHGHCFCELSILFNFPFVANETTWRICLESDNFKMRAYAKNVAVVTIYSVIGLLLKDTGRLVWSKTPLICPLSMLWHVPYTTSFHVALIFSWKPRASIFGSLCSTSFSQI